MRTRIVGAAVLVATALTMVTACSPFTDVNCPAIAHASNATIALANPRAGLTLELCDGDGCIPGPPLEPVQIGTTHQPNDTTLHNLTGSSEVGWQATFVLGGEPVMGYRLTNATGVIVDEGYVTVDWIRIDGSEQCGGTRQTTVELPV